MTATTINGGHAPQQFLVFDTVRSGGAIVDEKLDGDDALQLGVAGRRRGWFEALYAAHSDALALEELLATAGTFVLVCGDRPLLSMEFVVPKTGTISVQLDRRTRNHFTVGWDFREVSS